MDDLVPLYEEQFWCHLTEFDCIVAFNSLNTSCRYFRMNVK